MEVTGVDYISFKNPSEQRPTKTSVNQKFVRHTVVTPNNLRKCIRVRRNKQGQSSKIPQAALNLMKSLEKNKLKKSSILDLSICAKVYLQCGVDETMFMDESSFVDDDWPLTRRHSGGRRKVLKKFQTTGKLKKGFHKIVDKIFN